MLFILKLLALQHVGTQALCWLTVWEKQKELQVQPLIEALMILFVHCGLAMIMLLRKERKDLSQSKPIKQILNIQLEHVNKY